MKVVIVGGVAGGATAAARIRRLDEQAEITVFERSGYISYANCGLPYYIGGAIEDESDLTLQTPESFWRRFRVNMNVHHEVTAINFGQKTVTVKNLDSGEASTESNDKLLLSPGARPVKPNFNGIDSGKIFTLRTVEDTLKIKKYVGEQNVQNAVVVGGGFIGIEVAENLRELGIADTPISLAGPANKQGRIAADNICGGDSHYTGGQGSSVIKIFDMTAAVTGINEKTAKALGINSEKVILSPMSHAGYYPGGKVMTMKVIFEQDAYRLLGAQIVGFDGVDKRIDVLATAIRAGMKAYGLAELDLAYAPPYSSAKDPVNMAGFMIENIKNGVVKQWYYEDTESLQNNENVTRLDTRTPMEYSRGHMDGFINIPVDELRERIGELDKNKPVYVICQSGLRSYIATRILMGNGFDAYNFAGGFRFYDVVHNDKALNKKSTPCGMDS